MLVGGTVSSIVGEVRWWISLDWPRVATNQQQLQLQIQPPVYAANTADSIIKRGADREAIN